MLGGKEVRTPRKVPVALQGVPVIGSCPWALARVEEADWCVAEDGPHSRDAHVIGAIGSLVLGVAIASYGVYRWSNRTDIVEQALSQWGDTDRRRRMTEKRIPASAVHFVVFRLLVAWTAAVEIALRIR